MEEKDKSESLPLRYSGGVVLVVVTTVWATDIGLGFPEAVLEEESAARGPAPVGVSLGDAFVWERVESLRLRALGEPLVPLPLRLREEGEYLDPDLGECWGEGKAGPSNGTSRRGLEKADAMVTKEKGSSRTVEETLSEIAVEN